MTKYKDIEDNKALAHFFADLLIDIYNNYTVESESFYTKLEQFHISFGQLKGFKSETVVNILTDNTFKYQITLSNNTVSPIIVFAPYVFNVSTDP